MFDDLAGKVNLVMFVICGFSLLVRESALMIHHAGAVAERTREIGAAQGAGARRARIMAQFVIEGWCWRSAGGVIGVLLGYGMRRWPLRDGRAGHRSALGVALSLGVSGGIGLLFGIYPAARRLAARPPLPCATSKFCPHPAGQYNRP